MNFKLRLAVEKAKQANMPRANIDKAIISATGQGEGRNWENIIYEGYGPGKTAIIVEIVTDNRNRALAEIKQIFDKAGGTLGQPGSVNYMFDKLGWIIIKPPHPAGDEIILQLMDIPGVVDINQNQEEIRILTQSEQFHQVIKQINQLGYHINESSVIMKPKITKTISEPDLSKLQAFLQKLEDSDEVQSIWSDYD
jgi:YebC/PmpR family DNA-binding regulatory protein